MNRIKLIMSQLFSNKLVRQALPFFVFIVVGALGLRQFAELRYKYRKTKNVLRETMEEHGIPLKDREELTLENQYEKMKNLKLNDWENKRIPRPWDEDKEEH